MGSSGEPAEKANWCFDSQGMFSMNCNVALNSNTALPMWAIIAIASTAAAIVPCLAISCCICSMQNRKDEDDVKNNFQSYVADPEQWRQVQIDGQQRKRRSVAAARPLPRRQRRHTYDERHHSRERRHRPRKERSFKQYTRSFRRPKRESHRHSRSPRRREKRRSPKREFEHRDTRETQPDEEMQMLALPPPQYEYVEPYYPPAPEPEELLALLAPDYWNSDAALYCDEDEVNRPDPPMLEGPTAIEQQQQQQLQMRQAEPEPEGEMLMLTDGRDISDRSGNNNGPYLAIESEGMRDSHFLSMTTTMTICQVHPMEKGRGVEMLLSRVV
jgi:hypothetical protein